MSHGGKRYALEAQRRPADYIDAVNERGVGWVSEQQLTSSEHADEMLIMGLRTDEGLDLARINVLRAKSIDPAAVAWLAEQGLVTANDGRIVLTRSGRVLANRIAAELA
jgi:oxygen-independent coproporphyrinogen-3 oxidase